MTKKREVWTGKWEGTSLRVILEHHRKNIWRVSMSEMITVDGTPVFSTHPDKASTNIRKTRRVLTEDGFKRGGT